MTDHIVDANNMVPPPPHLLKKFSEQARADGQKRVHSGYCKTFTIQKFGIGDYDAVDVDEVLK